MKNYQVSIVNYSGPVSEDWHYHPHVHISSILQGGNMESRKRNDIQVVPGKILAYPAGEIHRNRYTLFPSKNLNIELRDEFFGRELYFSNFQPDHQAYLSLIKIYHELSWE
ncbi:MAG: hypothetical protein AAFU64_21025 [Bacteroidota bacterium]